MTKSNLPQNIKREKKLKVKGAPCLVDETGDLLLARIFLISENALIVLCLGPIVQAYQVSASLDNLNGLETRPLPNETA